MRVSLQANGLFWLLPLLHNTRADSPPTNDDRMTPSKNINGEQRINDLWEETPPAPLSASSIPNDTLSMSFTTFRRRKTQQQQQQEDLEPPKGPGCNFRHEASGLTISFEEGASMGNFAMVTTCANNIPEAFPCYCVSDAPGQTVCPYCFYQDTFGQTICGRADNTIGFLHPNRTVVNCGCSVTVNSVGSSYQVDVTSTCDMTPALPATYADPSSPSMATIVGTNPVVTDTTNAAGDTDMTGATTTAPPIVISPAPTSVAPSTVMPTDPPATVHPTGTIPDLVTNPPITNPPITASPITAPPIPPPTETIVTTAAPITAAPTNPPVTAAPTPLPTNPPVTAAPIFSPTNPPITAAPSTVAPVPSPTNPPMTAAPVTAVPTTAAPVPPPTNPPVTAAPITAAPVPPPTNPPITAAPITAAPVPPPTNPPITAAPVTTTTTTTTNPVTYQPGNLTHYQDGIWLSHGLSVKRLAMKGQPVVYHSSTPYEGSQSTEVFHERPDGAAVFNDTRTFNMGGWVYVSNSEIENGSVNAMTFNSKGDVIHYHRILTGSMWNCNGGKTPWGTWVTAEEDFDKKRGVAYQVDVFGSRQPEALTLGIEGGVFEAFAYDIRNLQVPRFFLSEDDAEGALRRWTPNEVNYGMDPWHLLHGAGVTEFLFLEPDFDTPGVNGRSGTYRWITDEKEARKNAKSYYRWSEGIDVQNNVLYVVTKQDKRLFQINLDDNTYSFFSTQSGLFDGEPDQIKSVLRDDGTKMIYFSEDFGQVSGIHARDEEGNFYTILEGSEYQPETTGISFSPDGKHMYFCYQDDGVLFDLTRDDGHSFHGTTVNLKPRHDENPARFRRQR